MHSMFERRNESYSLCNFQEFLTDRKTAVHYGRETLSIRSILPEKIKKVESLKLFRRKVKNWIYSDCPCRLCESLSQNIGFL